MSSFFFWRQSLSLHWSFLRRSSPRILQHPSRQCCDHRWELWHQVFLLSFCIYFLCGSWGCLSGFTRYRPSCPVAHLFSLGPHLSHGSHTDSPSAAHSSPRRKYPSVLMWCHLTPSFPFHLDWILRCLLTLLPPSCLLCPLFYASDPLGHPSAIISKLENFFTDIVSRKLSPTLRSLHFLWGLFEMQLEAFLCPVFSDFSQAYHPYPLPLYSLSVFLFSSFLQIFFHREVRAESLGKQNKRKQNKSPCNSQTG